jgi:hypothetical protein
MNIESIQDPVLRARFQEIADMSEEQLFALGVNSVIRDRIFAGISVPERSDACWIWQKGFGGSPSAPRPAVWFKGKLYFAYRVLMALLNKKPIHELNWILHKCPGKENCRCVDPAHLKEADSRTSGAKENAEDRVRYGSLHGDRNGSRLHPESRPRGMAHAKSPFKDPREVQMIRATFHAAPEKFGVIAALVRHTTFTRAAVTAAIHGYPDVADDPTAALDLSLLDIRLPQDRTGDRHGRTQMPEAAVKLFYQLFQTSSNTSGKCRLVEFVAEKFGMAPESLDDIAHRRSRKNATEGLDAVIAAAPKTEITDALLAALFQPHAPLKEVRKA